MNEQDNYLKEDQIDLLALLQFFLSKWWLLLIASVTGTLLSYGYTSAFMVPQYRSNASLYVLSSSTSITSLADLQIGTQLIEDYLVIAKSKPVIDRTVKRLEEEYGLSYGRYEILGMLSIGQQATRIITVTVTGPNAEEVSIIANILAEETAVRMAEITKTEAPSIVERAEPANTVFSPNKAKNTGLGFLIGFAIIIAALTITYILNDNIKSDEDVSRYMGLSTLAAIPYNRTRDVKHTDDKKGKKK